MFKKLFTGGKDAKKPDNKKSQEPDKKQTVTKSDPKPVQNAASAKETQKPTKAAKSVVKEAQKTDKTKLQTSQLGKQAAPGKASPDKGKLDTNEKYVKE